MNSSNRPTYAWWLVLCIVGLDYFSSIAYLPSIAITFDQGARDLAPIAGFGVVLVTLLAALPVYWYVIGRSPHGTGGVGLLERLVTGWSGKLLILFLLGFIATDFVLTRTLSMADAATHLLNNPYYLQFAPSRAAVAGWFRFEGWSTLVLTVKEQLVVTLLLSIGSFGLYYYFVRSLSRGFLSFAVAVVLLYLVVNAIVIANGLSILSEHPTLLREWQARLLEQLGEKRLDGRGAIGMILLFAFQLFPPMAIGLSGFELTMASATSVEGGSKDTESRPVGRIWGTRWIMLVAAVVMSILVLGANTICGLLIEPGSLVNPVTGEIEHRAMSYLAHGGRLADNSIGSETSSIFGPTFGTVYDVSSILILGLAGAGATISLRDVVPTFLSRFGMQLSWAHRIGIITHLFNAVILLVTVVFKANVTNQIWAYAAAVIALLLGASFAAYLDVKRRSKGGVVGFFARLPFLVITALFVVMGLLITVQQPSGVAIALAFVLVVLITAITSRWLRSTELRFQGFEFADETTQQRWEQICSLDYQVLVPHDPKMKTIEEKEFGIRRRHRIANDVPIIFIQVKLGDPSDFFHKPVMQIVNDAEGREIIEVSQATSVAHVLAAIGLSFREVGEPPEMLFKWSTQAPMEATLNFLLLGEGNVPLLVHTLIRKAERDPAKRPRVIIADD